MKKLLVLSVLVLTVMLASASDALAGDTPCIGILVGTFDNVVVPPGQTCMLNNSTVRGNVKALENSRLFINNSMVRGNVDGDKANAVQLNDSTVGGSIQIKEGGPGPFTEAHVRRVSLPDGGNIQIEKITGSVFIERTTVLKGNIKVEENTILFVLNTIDNFVGGNFQVFKNRGGSLGKFVARNTVLQDLQCFENDQPFVGGPNTARKAEGQCF